MVAFGFHAEWLADLDMISFLGLAETQERVHAISTVRLLEGYRAAQHAAKPKDFEKALVEGFLKPAGIEAPRKAAKTAADSEAFRKRFG